MLFDENGELFVQVVNRMSIRILMMKSLVFKQLQLLENSTIKRDYEHKHLETVSLLAAMDLLTGEAIPCRFADCRHLFFLVLFSTVFLLKATL